MDINEAVEIVRRYLEQRCATKDGLWKFEVLIATKDDVRCKIAIRCVDSCLGEFKDHTHEAVVDQTTKQLVAIREI